MLKAGDIVQHGGLRWLVAVVARDTGLAELHRYHLDSNAISLRIPANLDQTDPTSTMVEVSEISKWPFFVLPKHSKVTALILYRGARPHTLNILEDWVPSSLSLIETTKSIFVRPTVEVGVGATFHMQHGNSPSGRAIVSRIVVTRNNFLTMGQKKQVAVQVTQQQRPSLERFLDNEDEFLE